MINAYLSHLKAVLKGGVALALLSGCTRGIDDRITAAYKLGRNPTDRHKNRIEALLQDADRDVRANALVVMAGVDMERATRMADGALDDPDGLVRVAAVSILGKRDEPETRHVLASMATEDPDWRVRSRALEAFASFDDPAVREAFSRALSDPVRHVRRAALAGGNAHPGLLPPDRLAELVLSDPDWENRVEAARALGASRDPAGAAALDAALADPNEFVRATAATERRAFKTVEAPR